MLPGFRGLGNLLLWRAGDETGKRIVYLKSLEIKAQSKKPDKLDTSFTGTET